MAEKLQSRFTIVGYVCQFFFGGWFLFHGLNYWTHFYFDGSVLPGPGLLPALDQSGLLAVVKVIEILISVALLTDRFVPLAAVAAFPVTVVIAYVNAVHGTLFGACTAFIIIALNTTIAVGHLARYAPMLVAVAGAPRPPALRKVLGRAEGGQSGWGWRLRLVAACLGIAAATTVTFVTLWSHS